MMTQDKIKRENLKTILNWLRRNPEMARTDLARVTGLQPSTVSNLVRDLVRSSWVLERGRGVSRAGGGKPVTLLTLNPTRAVYLAFLWSPYRIDGALVDCTGTVLARTQETFLSSDPVGHVLEEGARRLMRRTTGSGPLLGISLSVGSVVDSTGSVHPSADFPHSLPNAHGVLRDVADAVTRMAGDQTIDSAAPAGAGGTGRHSAGAEIVTVVENDANCLAINAAQSTEGNAEHLLALVFTAEPPSVGAGFISGSTIWRGARGSAGELLPSGDGHSVRDLDRAAATAVRFVDPEELVVSLPAVITWKELRATREAVEETRIPVRSVIRRDEALLGAAYLAYRESLEVHITTGEVD